MREWAWLAAMHRFTLPSFRRKSESSLAVEGNTTLVLLVKGEQHSINLNPGELVVVPQGYWHRFETSTQLKVMSVTPQPTEHCLEVPGI